MSSWDTSYKISIENWLQFYSLHLGNKLLTLQPETHSLQGKKQPPNPSLPDLACVLAAIIKNSYKL